MLNTTAMSGPCQPEKDDRAFGVSEVSGAEGPNLVKKGVITRNESVELLVRKCRCNHPWCPSCGKYSLRKNIERMRSYDWRHVRLVEFTIDPAKFKDGSEAYFYLKEKKKLSETVKEIERGGARILDYVRFTEWHRNGFPHYHYVIHVADEGKAGQIGADRLRKAWGLGRVHEGFLKTEKHWLAYTGYFDKHGYFKSDKAHQVELPEWAKDSTVTIRRTSARVESKRLDEVREKTASNKSEVFKDEVPEVSTATLTNRDILESCGVFTSVSIILKRTADGGLGRTYDLEPYKLNLAHWRSLGAVFVKGLGHTITLPVKQFHELTKLYQMRGGEEK